MSETPFVQCLERLLVSAASAGSQQIERSSPKLGRLQYLRYEMFVRT